jgi:peptide/nickel transport system substrate-binding protein
MTMEQRRSRTLVERANVERLSRRRFLARLAVVGGVIGGGTGLLAACAPQAPAPAKPDVGAQKPAGPPATSAPAPAAAAQPTAAPAQVAPAAAKPGASGSILLVVQDEPRTLANWHSYATTGYVVLRNTQEALLNRDPKTNQLVGELATRWEPANPTTWRFTLRQGVKFHDGSPFNAESAAFGINYTWDKANAFEIRAFIGPEINAKPVDEYTLDVVTATPDPILPARLYFSPIPSMKLIKESPDQYGNNPVGTGPYRFVEWVKGQQIKLEVNPDWWGHTAKDAGGAATIKNVTLVARKEQHVRGAMLKSGEADLSRWLNAEQCGEMSCVHAPGVETVFMRLDTQHPSLSDLRVRQAIGLSLDKASMIQSLIGGGTVARQLVGPSALGYNPKLEPVPYDPEQATKLVAEAKAAGVPIDAPLTIYARTDLVPRSTEVCEAALAMMQAVGLTNTKVKMLDQVTYQDLAVLKPIPPDRGMVAIHMHGNELMDYAATISSYYASSGKNSTLDDPQLDEMHQKALPSTGAEREQAYQAIAVRAQQNANIIPIGHPDFYFGLNQRLKWQARLDGFILVKEMSLI